jgi:hypothetical protein
MARRARKFKFNNRTGRLVVDNNEIVDSSGEIAIGGGKIIQITNKFTSSEATYSCNNNNVGNPITALNHTITPSATSSKIMVIYNMSFEVHHDSVLRLYRGSTIIGRNTSSTARWSGTFLPGYDADTGSTNRTNTYVYVDSPNTTSAITYKLYTLSSGGSNHTFYLNRTTGSTGGDNHENATSNVTLIEIGA